MNHFICTTCGVQYDVSAVVPAKCSICDEERQYIHPEGQSWITMEGLKEGGTYKNMITCEETGLYSIETAPNFAIGQTAYLIQNDGFNLLWDCLTYLDENTVNQLNELGGIQAIALSHPHYYSAQVEWADAFDAPIYIHEDDKEWVMRPSDRIIFWSGNSLQLNEGLTLYRLGGHFKGGAVLHWRSGRNGKGVLMTGDIIQVVADRQWVSFMYSYPNLIPLPASQVEEMAHRVSDLQFDRLYNGFHRVVKEKANLAVQNSAKRYIEALQGTLFVT
ncbi:MBL fold metallo-hydrolase [Bacillus sp. CECT 9360]|uniref:MBL fold metallo-hydrolase n=1 Tax=Bacillus sp. CECT 9360 TaxID=2845821 RepID=UPI001E31FC60|nr:MBL fold metallo-hydrolase [Bacillus sp. CECT 9360]CAH0347248.1 hypothetical protein BCI9360_03639 [Bacillus sp. CECT 9360]